MLHTCQIAYLPCSASLSVLSSLFTHAHRVCFLRLVGIATDIVVVVGNCGDIHKGRRLWMNAIEQVHVCCCCTEYLRGSQHGWHNTIISQPTESTASRSHPRPTNYIVVCDVQTHLHVTPKIIERPHGTSQDVRIYYSNVHQMRIIIETSQWEQWQLVVHSRMCYRMRKRGVVVCKCVIETTTVVVVIIASCAFWTSAFLRTNIMHNKFPESVLWNGQY